MEGNFMAFILYFSYSFLYDI